MLRINHSKTVAVITWDHREQPNWNHIQKAVSELNKRWVIVKFSEVETGCDEYAVVLSGEELDMDSSYKIYQESYSWE